MKLPKIKLTSTTIFWIVFIGLLMVLWPQTAWTIDQLAGTDNGHITIMGITASPLAWALAGVIESTIAIAIYRLNKHWENTPRPYTGNDPKGIRTSKRRRFAHRWLNAYVAGLVVTSILSAVGNYTHVVEYTNLNLKVFQGRPGVITLYQALFGLALPGVSMVFAWLLSTMQAGEQEEDPAFAKTKADLSEAKGTIRQLEKGVRETEKLLNESEQRYRAVGDVVRYLFGTDLEMRERIRGVRMVFPELSQNGIAQVLGCSVSTVNQHLQGFELPDVINIPILEESKS